MRLFCVPRIDIFFVPLINKHNLHFPTTITRWSTAFLALCVEFIRLLFHQVPLDYITTHASAMSGSLPGFFADFSFLKTLS